MELSAAIIYGPGEASRRAPAWSRLFALCIAAGCMAVLILAARLTPSHAGYGTHTAIGLPDCAFLQRTGVPCPGCGMTTSFSWFVRGNLAASVYVQPMGALLAAVSCSAIWISMYVAVTGRPVYRLIALAPSELLFGLPLAVGLLAWAWKICIHLAGHDGW
ncbi:MAG TPA: DUF2752 domain-containing protein [Tepidisphaeraceae bacterium]|nr:DUF2752 domain-containing protein [Tepidisphaeraceae bacterium]